MAKFHGSFVFNRKRNIVELEIKQDMSRGTAKYVVRAQATQAWLIKYCILKNLLQETISRICIVLSLSNDIIITVIYFIHFNLL